MVCYVWAKFGAWSIRFPLLVLPSYIVCFVAAWVTEQNVNYFIHNSRLLFNVTSQWSLWFMFISGSIITLILNVMVMSILLEYEMKILNVESDEMALTLQSFFYLLSTFLFGYLSFPVS
jgi:hypothetical protein